MARVALWQILFAARGASAEAVRRIADEGMTLLRGLPVAEMRALVAEHGWPVLEFSERHFPHTTGRRGR